jgi:signal transduction histidine kinase
VIALMAAARARGGQAADLAERLEQTRLELATRIEESERGKQARDAALAALQEGVLLIGPEGDVRYRNPSASRLLGEIPPSLRYLVPPDLRTLVTDAGGDGSATAEVLTTTMPARTLRAVATAIPEEGSVVLVLRDITEALTIDAVRRDFVANASHELKTPVASIQALAETMSTAADEDPASVRRFAMQLEGEAVRLSRIITDLLDLSRLEAGSGDPRSSCSIGWCSRRPPRSGNAPPGRGSRCRSRPPVRFGSGDPLAISV